MEKTDYEFTTHHETIVVSASDIDYIEHNENDYPLLHLKTEHVMTGRKEMYIEFIPKGARQFLRG